MPIIKLTQNKETIVDEIDFQIFNQFKWYYINSGDGYAIRRKGNKHVLLHREILNLHNPRIFGDHINGDTLDNRRSNLRIVTAKINCRNQKSHKNTTSKYIGVSLYKYSKKLTKWVAHIRVDKKLIYLGIFKTEIEASLARLQYIKDNKLEGFRN